MSLSVYVISTDAALLPCWAAALYAFVRARESDGRGWWIAAGVAAGLGLLAKYAMVYWLISALGFVLLVPGERRHLRPLLGAAGVAALIYAPNLWWNWSNGFVSYLHVRDNADLSRHFVNPAAFLEFLGSQFAVAGPLLFAALLAMLARPRLLRGAARPPARRLHAAEPRDGAVPELAVTGAAELGGPSYVAASVLVVGWALAQGRRRWVGISVAVNIAIAVAVFGASDALASAGLPFRPSTIRCIGCAAGGSWARRSRTCSPPTPD